MRITERRRGRAAPDERNARRSEAGVRAYASVRHRTAGFDAIVHAPMAGFSADPAVFVMLGMTRAFVAADTANRGARVEHAQDDFHVGSGSAGRDTAGCAADIRTVEIQADALPQLVDHVLGEARVRAGGTGLRAGIAFFDASDEDIVGAAADIRMRADHLLNLHGKPRVSWSTFGATAFRGHTFPCATTNEAGLAAASDTLSGVNSERPKLNLVR
jgi:hypothetical protein